MVQQFYLLVLSGSIFHSPCSHVLNKPRPMVCEQEKIGLDSLHG